MTARTERLVVPLTAGITGWKACADWIDLGFDLSFALAVSRLLSIPPTIQVGDPVFLLAIEWFYLLIAENMDRALISFRIICERRDRPGLSLENIRPPSADFELQLAAVKELALVAFMGKGFVGRNDISARQLGHQVCRQRTSNGDCTKLRNAGIERDVLYFIFPGTHSDIMSGLNADNIVARIEAIGSKAWQQLVMR
jgi:hypothetical protein